MTEPTIHRKGATCPLCGNGGPSKRGVRYACAMPEGKRRDQLPCPMDWPKESHMMTPADVARAYNKLGALRDFDEDIRSVKSTTLQVMYNGRYRDGTQEKEIVDAARSGILRVLDERRSALIAELRTLGVEVSA